MVKDPNMRTVTLKLTRFEALKITGLIAAVCNTDELAHYLPLRDKIRQQVEKHDGEVHST